MKKLFSCAVSVLLCALILFAFAVSAAAENSDSSADSEPEQPDKPEASVISGAYDGITELTVELNGAGKIYYTTDASLPTENSSEYTSPLKLRETTILRAISVLPDGQCSKTATFSYFINENHTLPILSLVNDSKEDFDKLYFSRKKDIELPSFLALYENGEEVFAKECGIQIKGNLSRSEAKVSLGAYFRGKYDGKIKDCDLFGNGITKYSSLSLRAGQDWKNAVFRSELFQTLCMEMSDNVPNQHTKFCILYIDGIYKGIYCLKENVNEHFYADWAGVDSDTVISIKGPAGMEDDVFDIIYFGQTKNMADPANYEYFCSKFDIDNLIDWAIIEGYSGNNDTMGNIRYFRSTEGDGKYRIALYDLDFGFVDLYCVMMNVLDGQGTAGPQVEALLNSLFKNPDFKDRFLTRFSSLLKTTLSNEHVLSVMKQFEDELSGEIDRSFGMYDMRRFDWEYSVQKLEKFLISNDMETYAAHRLCSHLMLKPDEIKKYFG